MARTVVAIDTGGTFTDFYLKWPGGERVHKVASTPDDPSRSIRRGLLELGLKGIEVIVHGSTVATNALLERKGARVALVTTAGFEDVLEIGRQNRPSLYDLNTPLKTLLVRDTWRLGVSERVTAGGRILAPLDTLDIRKIQQRLRRSNADSIAICLLFSFANPSHEKRIARALKSLGRPLSISSEICPEYREYERCSTTCVNAYVAPVMDRYLGRLRKKISRPIRIMQSNGGSLSIAEAGSHAVRTLLSGPAGGALGALQVGRRAGFNRLISLEMGGTSTDMSLVDGKLELTSEAELGGFPVKTPMIRIDTLGAGGGSIAWIDAGGALRVGPESAGADPGPVCYGKGGRHITVTDAHLFLGRISSSHFLGGRMRLLPAKVGKPLKALARRLKLSPHAAAAGIVTVANANMVRALRVLTLQRGYDPREFTLLAFGGAGGLHACELAAALEIPRVMIPSHPGILSAFGMAHADWVRDYVQTVLLPEGRGSFAVLKKTLRVLRRLALRDARRERFHPSALRFKEELDVRYRGQSYELIVEFRPGFRRLFERAHRIRFGYTHEARPIEIVNIRLQACVPSAVGASAYGGRPASSNDRRLPFVRPKESVRLFWNHQFQNAGVLQRDEIPVNGRLTGPAIIAEYSATTFLAPGWNLSRDALGNLILNHG